MAFKDRLKEARLRNNMTQEQLSQKIGVAKSTVAGYEKGNSEPNINTISKIMNVLQIDANYLLQDEMSVLNTPSITLEYDEIDGLRKFRSLDSNSKEHIQIILSHELDRAQVQKDTEKRLLAYKKKILALCNSREPVSCVDCTSASDNIIINKRERFHTDT